MRARCPSARFVSVAQLPDHRLDFTRYSQSRGCGVADAVLDPGRQVWGVVYEISEADLERLDESEGFSPGRAKNSYTREERQVLADGNAAAPMTVFLYFAERQANPPRPNAEYKKLIVEGAKFWNLPQSYIDELERIVIEP